MIKMFNVLIQVVVQHVHCKQLVKLLTQQLTLKFVMISFQLSLANVKKELMVIVLKQQLIVRHIVFQQQ